MAASSTDRAYGWSDFEAVSGIVLGAAAGAWLVRSWPGLFDGFRLVDALAILFFVLCYRWGEAHERALWLHSMEGRRFPWWWF